MNTIQHEFIDPWHKQIDPFGMFRPKYDPFDMFDLFQVVFIYEKKIKIHKRVKRVDLFTKRVKQVGPFMT